jgi:hypothetical protein
MERGILSLSGGRPPVAGVFAAPVVRRSSRFEVAPISDRSVLRASYLYGWIEYTTQSRRRLAQKPS